MEHMYAQTIAIVNGNITGLPVDNRVERLQPINSKHNVMVQPWQNSTFDNTMQSLAMLRAHNQGNMICGRCLHLTIVSKRDLHISPRFHR